MCVVKTPKIQAPTQTGAKEKPLPVLTNPLLDGVDPSGSLRVGRNSLRIRRDASASGRSSVRISGGR